MPGSDMNYLAIVLLAVLSNIIGMFWYCQGCFGKVWAKKCHFDVTKMKATPWHFVGSFITAFIMAWIVSLFVIWLNMTMWTEGLKLGFTLWLGFVATSHFCAVIWAKKPVKVFCIEAGRYLVTLLIMGAILAAWRA